jgi:hypothetical protein
MALTVKGTIIPAEFSNPNTPTHQGGGWSWFESNSDLDFDIPLWKGKVNGYSYIYGDFSFNSCIKRTGLISSSKNDPVNIKNQQYCQDGNTIF